MTPEINPQWIRLVARLLDDTADHHEIYDCGHWDYPSCWSAAEREGFRRRVADWTGYDDGPFPSPTAPDVLSFLAEYLRGVADRLVRDQCQVHPDQSQEIVDGA